MGRQWDIWHEGSVHMQYQGSYHWREGEIISRDVKNGRYTIAIMIDNADLKMITFCRISSIVRFISLFAELKKKWFDFSENYIWKSYLPFFFFFRWLLLTASPSFSPSLRNNLILTTSSWEARKSCLERRESTIRNFWLRELCITRSVSLSACLSSCIYERTHETHFLYGLPVNVYYIIFTWMSLLIMAQRFSFTFSKTVFQWS